MLVDGIDAEFWGLSERSATMFRVASSEGDYADCMCLIEAHGWPVDYQLVHPTIMAERDGELIGCIGTRVIYAQGGRSVQMAGPLALERSTRRPVLAYRLLLQYELAMRTKGITRVCFDMDKGSAMERAVLKAVPSLRPYHETETVAWYVWDFDHLGARIGVAA